MRYSFNELKKKCVINVTNGKKLGKITDVIFTMPQNCLKGFSVENGPFSFCGQKITFGVCQIQKIGEDAILVNLGDGEKPQVRGNEKPRDFIDGAPCNLEEDE